MKKKDLNLLLSELATTLPNPFKNPKFSISGMETLGLYVSFYKVSDVSLEFKDLKLIILFPKLTGVLGAAVTTLILSNPYASDPEAKLYINKKEIKYEHSFDYFTNTKTILEKVFSAISSSQEVKIEIEIHFSKEWVWKFNKQDVIFLKDEFHDDFFHFQKEVDRRQSLKKN